MSAHTRSRRRMTAALAITVCVAALAGCSGSAPSIEATAARQLQSSVVAIAHSAAAGNANQAMSRLDKLSTAVQADTASGTITSKRAAVIRAAIAKVRADLTAAIQSKPQTATPSPDSSGSSGSESSSTPSSTPVPTTGGSGGSGTSGGSTQPPATSTSSPSDSPTASPSAPPPTSGSTSGP